MESTKPRITEQTVFATVTVAALLGELPVGIYFTFLFVWFMIATNRNR